MSGPIYDLDAIPDEAMERIAKAVAIGEVQRSLLATGQMTSSELNLYRWTVDVQPGDSRAGHRRHFVVNRERIVPQ